MLKKTSVGHIRTDISNHEPDRLSKLYTMCDIFDFELFTFSQTLFIVNTLLLGEKRKYGEIDLTIFILFGTHYIQTLFFRLTKISVI